MKRITLFILFLIIVSLACGGQPSTDSTTPQNADHMVEFDKAGVAVLREPSGGTICLQKHYDISIP
jgi:hypothetical protein